MRTEEFQERNQKTRRKRTITGAVSRPAISGRKAFFNFAGLEILDALVKPDSSD